MLSPQEEPIVQCFAQLSQVFRLPVSTGKVFGLLFAHPAGLGFTEIRQKLEISKPSVSHALRFLRDIKAIYREADAQGAGHHYRTQGQGSLIVKGFFQSELSPVLEQELRRLEAIPKSEQTERTRHLHGTLKKATQASQLIKLAFPKEVAE